MEDQILEMVEQYACQQEIIKGSKDIVARSISQNCLFMFYACLLLVNGITCAL